MRQRTGSRKELRMHISMRKLLETEQFGRTGVLKVSLWQKNLSKRKM